MAEALLGLGGNLGDVRLSLDRAVELLCEDGRAKVRAQSSDFRTPPWGVEGQPAYINRCVMLETGLGPRALLERALAVERALGRDRARERRWGPRPIDIDLLSYDDEGFVSIRGQTIDVPAGQEDFAREAEATCPEGAIILIED